MENGTVKDYTEKIKKMLFDFNYIDDADSKFVEGYNTCVESQHIYNKTLATGIEELIKEAREEAVREGYSDGWNDAEKIGKQMYKLAKKQDE